MFHISVHTNLKLKNFRIFVKMQDYIFVLYDPQLFVCWWNYNIVFSIFVQQMLSKYHVILYPFELQHEVKLTKSSFYFNIFESTRILWDIEQNYYSKSNYAHETNLLLKKCQQFHFYQVPLQWTEIYTPIDVISVWRSSKTVDDKNRVNILISLLLSDRNCFNCNLSYQVSFIIIVFV